MPIPKLLIIRYFQLINNRQFTEAQRELQRIREKITKTEWNRGYYRALLGLLLAQKHNGNQYTLLANLDPYDKASLKQHRNEFQKHVQNRFAQEYDRGYFSAWNDYLRILIQTAGEAKPPPQGQTNLAQYAQQREESEAEESETILSD